PVGVRRLGWSPEGVACRHACSRSYTSRARSSRRRRARQPYPSQQPPNMPGSRTTPDVASGRPPSRAREPFAMVPFSSVHDRLLDEPRALQLYVELKKLAGSRGWASPTPDDLCARFKCSLATTERAIAVLKERRCIRVKRDRRDDGTLGRRVFSFLDPPDDGRNDEPSHNSPMTSGRPHLTRDKHHNSRVSSQFVDVQATLDQ